MKKRILIFSLNYYPKFIGGAEIAIKEIVERLYIDYPDLYEFHMLTLRFDSDLPKYEIIHGIHIHRIGFTKKNANILDLKNTSLKYNKYIYQIYAGIYAVFLHIKYNFDIAWSMMAHSTGVPTAIFKTLVNIKYILTLQEGDDLKYIEKLAKPIWPLFKRAFTKADHIQTISSFLKDWAIHMGSDCPISIIPNGYDENIFKKPIFDNDNNNNDVQKTQNLNIQNSQNPIQNPIQNNDIKYLITTSRLVYKNAIDIILDAMAILSTNIHLKIIGIGPDELLLKQKVKDLKLENRVMFLGQMTQKEIAEELHKSHIFIRPSRTEGMGNSFIEAMASFLPVIATREGGLSDFIFDKKTAFVVEKDNPSQIKEQIEYILKNENNDIQNILNNAYELVKHNYNWNNIANRLHNEVFTNKVIIAAGIYTPSIGGPAIHAEKVYEYFKKNDDRTALVIFEKYNIYKPIIRHIKVFIELYKKTLKNDIIIAFDAFSIAFPAVLVALFKDTKIIIRTGGDMIHEEYIEKTGHMINLQDFYKKNIELSFKLRIKQKITRFIYRFADKIIFNSIWQRDIMINAGFTKIEKTEIILNPFEKREKNTNMPNFENMIFVSKTRPVRFKNIEMLDQIFSELPSKFVLDKKTETHEKLMISLKESHALIIASISDISPNTVYDALSVGTPVILTKYTGLLPLLNDYVYIIDPENKESIKKAILDMSNPDIYKIYKQKAIDFVNDQSYEKLVQEYAKIALCIS